MEASRYGTDDYGRFYEDTDGERYAIEPYPFGGWTPWRLRSRIAHRWWLLKWHLATSGRKQPPQEAK